MSTQDERNRQVARVANDLLSSEMPQVLEFRHLADQLCERLSITLSTAFKRIHSAVRAELLNRFTPKRVIKENGRFAWSTDDLPTVYPRVYIQHVSTSPHETWLLTTDESEAYGDYGQRPGRRTFLSTPDQTARIISRLTAADKAEQEAERRAAQERAQAERAEINRRDPELLPLLDTLWKTLGGEPNEVETRLTQQRDTGLQFQRLVISVTARTPHGTDNLRRILQAGLATLENEKRTEAAHG